MGGRICSSAHVGYINVLEQLSRTTDDVCLRSDVNQKDDNDYDAFLCADRPRGETSFVSAYQERNRCSRSGVYKISTPSLFSSITSAQQPTRSCSAISKDPESRLLKSMHGTLATLR